jgi:hypothetical protein
MWEIVEDHFGSEPTKLVLETLAFGTPSMFEEGSIGRALERTDEWTIRVDGADLVIEFNGFKSGNLERMRECEPDIVVTLETRVPVALIEQYLLGRG